MSEILLQLLVFEHATGDVAVQTEAGGLIVNIGSRQFTFRRGYLCQIYGEHAGIREAIDKAVAEQYGQRPEPPYIEKDETTIAGLNATRYVLVLGEDDRHAMPQRMFHAFCDLAGKELPVVDASESQVKSEWKPVFPPEADTFTKEWIDVPLANTWKEVTNHLCEQMQKETTFTVWRLTVTR